jgi:putative ABC transport system ATP-binding protein
MKLLQKLNNEGKTIIMVTHEPDIAELTKRIITLHDGLVVEDKQIPQKLL